MNQFVPGPPHRYMARLIMTERYSLFVPCILNFKSNAAGLVGGPLRATRVIATASASFERDFYGGIPRCCIVFNVVEVDKLK